MKCPACGRIHPEDAVQCGCGYDLAPSKFLYRSFTQMGIQEFFTNSWRTYAGAWQTFLLLCVLYAVLSQGLELGTEVVPVAVSLVIRSIALILTTMALTMTAHKASEGEAVDVGESFTLSIGLFGGYIWTWALYALIVLGGLFLFIIPGIIWSFVYILAPYAVIVEGINGRAALSRSRVLTKGKSILVYESGFGLLFLLAIALPLFLITLLVGVILGDPWMGFLVPKPEWAKAIESVSRITYETLFIIFNVLLFKSLRKA